MMKVLSYFHLIYFRPHTLKPVCSCIHLGEVLEVRPLQAVRAVPAVTARGPGQGGGEGGKQEPPAPRNEHVVVQGYHPGNGHPSKTQTCRRK